MFHSEDAECCRNFMAHQFTNYKKGSSHSHNDESIGFDYYNKRLAIKHVFKTIYQQAEPEL